MNLQIKQQKTKEAFEIDPVTLNQVPYTDLNRYIKKYLELQWNNSNNILHRIKTIH